MILTQYGTKTINDLLSIIFESTSDLETDRAVNALVYKRELERQRNQNLRVYRKTIAAGTATVWDVSDYNSGNIPFNWRDVFMVFQNGLKVPMTVDFTMTVQKEILPPAEYEILGDVEILAYYSEILPRWWSKIFPMGNYTVLDISDFRGGNIPSNWRDVFMVHQNGVKVILGPDFTLNGQNQILLPVDYQMTSEIEVIAIY